ncbi:MAG: NAD(P)-dependent oxidoreductase, partial [Anaerolineales bacterium]|nr:NAD(P)-dependent oxidoreductase [Anaerolineales bacterium]
MLSFFTYGRSYDPSESIVYSQPTFQNFLLLQNLGEAGGSKDSWLGEGFSHLPRPYNSFLKEALMRILITGSSGQIGTNLGLHLQSHGHYVFGIDKRPNSWTTEIETLLQDLSTPQRSFNKGIGHVEYPPDLDAVVHFAAHAKVHELVEQPDRALENITMTFNVLEFCRQNNLPLIFSSSREVYG